MDVKKIMLLVGALVIAAVTAVMARNMFAGAGAEQASAAPAVPLGPKVLVARKALPVGTIIDAEALTYQPWPKELMQGAYYIEGAAGSDVKQLLGTVVRFPITAGQPLTRGALVGPKDRGFLAAALGAGMRAVTVPVDDKTGGVGGFVFPGDRVDLVLTQEIEGGGEGEPLSVSETIVRNMRVLATDQSFVKQTTEEGETAITKAKNVTLEVTPRIAEKIAVAQSMGTLSLSLRSIADNSAELQRAIASGEVRVPQGANPAEERRLLQAVQNRPLDSNPTFTTGGDVSRFQRRTVPGRESNQAAQSNLANAQQGGGKGGASAPVVTGPVVRVTRGNEITVVPVGAR